MATAWQTETGSVCSDCRSLLVSITPMVVGIMERLTTTEETMKQTVSYRPNRPFERTAGESWAEALLGAVAFIGCILGSFGMLAL